MTPSKRILTLNGAATEDDGWGVYYQARDMVAAGQSVTMLSIGDHDTPTPQPIIDATKAALDARRTKYAPVQGTPDLRDAIAARVAARTNVPTTRDNIFVATGGQGALFAAMMATTEPGDTAVIIDPYYTTYPPTLRAAGTQVRILGADPDRGFQIDPDALMDATKGARTLLINTPNNPTGAVYTPDTCAAIAQACLAHDLWLISDEVYDTQTYARPHVSLRSLPDMAARTITVGSLSKSHVMTGFRIGWAVGPGSVIAPMTDLTNATTYGAPGFVQDAALAALSCHAEEAETAALYARRRNLAITAFQGQNTIRLSPPDGAMYVMLDIRATGLSGHEFATRLLAQERISTMPGESFGTAAAGHIRVALTVPDAELTTALARISDFAHRL